MQIPALLEDSPAWYFIMLCYFALEHSAEELGLMKQDPGCYRRGRDTE